MRIRLRALRVHRISPHVRDDRDPPLVCRETREVMPLICPTGKRNIFVRRDGQEIHLICPSGKLMENFAVLLSYGAHISEFSRPIGSLLASGPARQASCVHSAKAEIVQPPADVAF
jgi:hypothetical protein